MKNLAPTTGICGAVYGDIIGMPYEWRATRTKDYNFHLKLNDFSDDTILTVAIAHWLLGDRSEQSLRQHMLEYAMRYHDKNVWGRGFQAWFESGGTLDRKGGLERGCHARGCHWLCQRRHSRGVAAGRDVRPHKSRQR